jgi:hypothetical protein
MNNLNEQAGFKISGWLLREGLVEHDKIPPALTPRGTAILEALLRVGGPPVAVPIFQKLGADVFVKTPSGFESIPPMSD